MLRQKERSDMALRLNSGKASLPMPPVSVVWIILVGFVLGTLLCSFDRSSREEVLKERKSMLTTRNDAMTIAIPPEKEKVPGTRIETATFAMG